MPSQQKSRTDTSAHWNSEYTRLKDEASRSTVPIDDERQLKLDVANMYRKFYTGREDEREEIPKATEEARTRREDAQTIYDNVTEQTQDDMDDFARAVMAADSALVAFEQPKREERYRPDWRPDKNPLWFDVEEDEDYNRGVAREREEKSKYLSQSDGGEHTIPPITDVGGSVSGGDTVDDEDFTLVRPRRAPSGPNVVPSGGSTRGRGGQSVVSATRGRGGGRRGSSKGAGPSGQGSSAAK